MKRLQVAALLFLVAFGAQAQEKSAGGGISVFVPESLYLYNNGSIAFEQGFSTAMGFTDIFSVPVGIAYHAAQGMRFSHKDAKSVDEPVLYGDAFIPSVMLKAHIGLGPMFYLEGFGGGALDWAFSLSPTADFARVLATGTEKVAIDSISLTKGIGYGWVAGGALGVKIGKISVDLGGTYRSLIIPVTVKSDIISVASDNTVTRSTVKLEDASALLRGVSVGLSGSFAF